MEQGIRASGSTGTHPPLAVLDMKTCELISRFHVRQFISEEFLARTPAGIPELIRRDLFRRIADEFKGFVELDERDLDLRITKYDPKEPDSGIPPFCQEWAARWWPSTKEAIVVVGETAVRMEVADLNAPVVTMGPAPTPYLGDLLLKSGLVSFDDVSTYREGWDPIQRAWVFSERSGRTGGGGEIAP